jgi:glutathione S-transferase
VYGDILSGNCYKVALLCSQLNIKHEWREVLITRGDTKTSDFLAMNPAGQIPLVVLDDGAVLTQSNAILHYFAQGSALLPADSLMHFRVLEWQFFEQYSHEPNIAVRRFIKKYEGLPAARQAEFDAKEAGSYRALNVMEKRLVDHEFLVADHYTLADISLYAYTHVADEAGLDLERYPGIRRWLGTVAAQPGYIAMESLP